ncbi:MAG: alkaline phosphatase family protein [Terriglobales bacterium]
MKMKIVRASPPFLMGYCVRLSKYAEKKSLVLVNGILTACIVLMASAAGAQSFQHVVIVVQENRSPDNLFQGLCSPSCGPYDIQQTNWKNLNAQGGITTPHEIDLVDTSDLGHSHKDFTRQYDNGKMDGADLGSCEGACPPLAHFAYVKPSDVQPYLDLAEQYGWANYMFQTNEGSSAPAHQYLFGGTSAPSAQDDAAGIFVAEDNGMSTGCLSAPGTLAWLIVRGVESPANRIYPCFERNTMGDLGLSWRYYTPSVKNLWTAPVDIQHICQPSGGICAGEDWKNLSIGPKNVLTDIVHGKLAQVSWVIPTGQNSDHPRTNTGGGPSWVASIVNAIGNSPYWQNTAIIVTWDDWGGWYDHEPPVLNGNGYEAGFRVPMLFISAYTPAGTVSNVRSDFGSILRFVEGNFGIDQGALGFADARATSNLSEFYNLSQSPRVFGQIRAPLAASHFLLDTTPATDPDDD